MWPGLTRPRRHLNEVLLKLAQRFRGEMRKLNLSRRKQSGQVKLCASGLKQKGVMRRVWRLPCSLLCVTSDIVRVCFPRAIHIDAGRSQKRLRTLSGEFD